MLFGSNAVLRHLATMRGTNVDSAPIPGHWPATTAASHTPATFMRFLPTRLRRLALVALLGLLAPKAARATGDDFLDETLVARSLGRREIGVELGTDSRVDRDYRVQGWFNPELELGVTRAWVLEGVGSFVNRGRGLEFGGWKAESRYVLLEQSHWPVSVAVAGEYEVETVAAKHPTQERLFVSRAIVTRAFGRDLLATANWGWDRRLAPVTGGAPAVSVGVRYPETATISYGFEYHRQKLENLTRFGPNLRVRLPNRMLLRLGGIVGHGSRVYRFIGRAILEADL